MCWSLDFLEEYIWYLGFIERNFYFWVKKAIEQIYRNMCPLSRILLVVAYLCLQNILFYH